MTGTPMAHDSRVGGVGGGGGGGGGRACLPVLGTMVDLSASRTAMLTLLFSNLLQAVPIRNNSNLVSSRSFDGANWCT